MSRTDGASWSQFLRVSLTDTSCKMLGLLCKTIKILLLLHFSVLITGTKSYLAVKYETYIIKRAQFSSKVTTVM